MKMEDIQEYFWKKPTDYHSYYNMRICGYVILTSAAVTLISNSALILVLTRKSFASPINTILAHISIIEILDVLAYTPRAWHEYFRVTKCSIQEHRTYTWEKISYYSYACAFLLRESAVFLTVILAVWRYIAIIHPLKERVWCNTEITRKVITATYLISILITIPPLFALNVEPMDRLLDENGCLLVQSNLTSFENTTTIYEIQFPIENYPIVYAVAAFIYAFFIKLLPSFIMSAISYKLIVSLFHMEKQRKEIVAPSFNDANADYYKKKQQMRKQTNRVTKILLIILMLFIMGELPHGIFSLLVAYYGPIFYWKYYYYAMEIFNTLTACTSTFNFTIYYLMSSQFRSTFKNIFNPNNRAIIISQISSTSLSANNKSQNYSRG